MTELSQSRPRLKIGYDFVVLQSNPFTLLFGFDYKIFDGFVPLLTTILKLFLI